MPDLTLGLLFFLNEAAPEDIYTVLGVDNSVRSRMSYGGTAPDQVRSQIERWRAALGRG